MKITPKKISIGLGALMFLATDLCAQTIPKVAVEVGEASDSGELSTTLQIVILMTVLALAPSLLIMVTSFVRFTVVLAFLRQAMGIQQMPPNQLLVALALILTFFVMSPLYGEAEQFNISRIEEDLRRAEGLTSDPHKEGRNVWSARHRVRQYRSWLSQLRGEAGSIPDMAGKGYREWVEGLRRAGENNV